MCHLGHDALPILLVLSDVPDPEIPVISLVDLGIIRDVAWQGDVLEVTVTPTYSGCPATRIINLDIETALRDHGVEQIALKRQLSPAWTTDWLSDSGKTKLEAYGIAPPTNRRWAIQMSPLPIRSSRENQPIRINALQSAMALY